MKVILGESSLSSELINKLYGEAKEKAEQSAQIDIDLNFTLEQLGFDVQPKIQDENQKNA